MRPLKVHRAQWTMKELEEHFCLKGDRDVRRLVMNCAIRPAMYCSREMHPVAFQGMQPVVDRSVRVAVSCWLWVVQEVAKQIDSFEFVYSILRDCPEHSADASYFAFVDEPVALTPLFAFAVVFDEHVRALEEERRRSDKEGADLSRRAENTRERILVTLAAEHLGWKPWNGEKALKGVQDLADASSSYGIGVSVETIKAHLRDSWQRCKPIQAK